MKTLACHAAARAQALFAVRARRDLPAGADSGGRDGPGGGPPAADPGDHDLPRRALGVGAASSRDQAGEPKVTLDVAEFCAAECGKGLGALFLFGNGMVSLGGAAMAGLGEERW